VLKVLLTVAVIVAAITGVLYADEGGYEGRGTHVDFGSALLNGLVMFVVVLVPLCGFAVEIARGLSSRRRSRAE